MPEVTGFAIFISHTWRTLSTHKYWYLLVRHGWLRVLPLMFNRGFNLHGVEFEAPASLWVWLVSSLALIVGLRISPYMPARSEACFLDMISINQVDKELMQKGIFGIGGFLQVTKEMVVLWSPPYFSRLL
ncbi:unnamed protein product, partial [Symbiodinium necroappetens]